MARLTLNIPDDKLDFFMVLISYLDFVEIIETEEDLDDVNAFDKANKSKQEFIDADEVFTKIKKKININKPIPTLKKTLTF